ncbi:MAG: phasin family protein [Candidatus Competibacter sp.]|nr:phasin family protein [Candidatus Competibacter sp.]MDG4582628.1 phasin family protein [Candidatus Competibacter sp.]
MNEGSVAFVEPFRPWVASLARVNQSMIGQLEKWVGLQMDSLRAYVDLGVAQAKVAMKVIDPHSLNEFADSQFAVASFVGHRVVDDGRMLAEWGTDCCNQTNRLARQNMLSVLFKD